MKEEQAKKIEEKGGQGWGEDKGGERELWEKDDQEKWDVN